MTSRPDGRIIKTIWLEPVLMRRAQALADKRRERGGRHSAKSVLEEAVSRGLTLLEHQEQSNEDESAIRA